MAQVPQILTLDVGTGSVRAGLVDLKGRILALSAVGHETIYPRHGWVEQRPEDWWAGAVQSIRGVLSSPEAAGPLQAVICCGQMHAPVLIDSVGQLVNDQVPLWNDKRTSSVADELNLAIAAGSFPDTVNSATTAWPGVKLYWLARHDPAALARTRWLMMPKDYLNFRLTGEVAMDWTEAGSSFLSDPEHHSWSDAAAARLLVPRAILPPLVGASERLGMITAAAAAATGLPQGLPVFGGAGDFPAAILGSGVTGEGQVSDITGTSFLLTRLGPNPMRHPEVMNVAVATGGWGSFAVVDAAGDAIRWASRALDRETHSYEALSIEAASVPPGSDGILFLPYLTGERLGQGPTSRAAFLGLTARHGAAHLHRAVMEGVVLAMQEAFQPIILAAGAPHTIVSAAGGARSDLWLQIKADIFDVPVVSPIEAEAGLLGCTALALAGLGHFASAAEAASQIVLHKPPVLPNPQARDRYAELAAAFAAVRRMTPQLNQIMGDLS